MDIFKYCNNIFLKWKLNDILYCKLESGDVNVSEGRACRRFLFMNQCVERNVWFKNVWSAIDCSTWSCKSRILIDIYRQFCAISKIDQYLL